ncbi:MAG: 30S ribosomal protein S12 methylthiotransferase RimO [Phycisphaerales bacterium]|nr:30S ribosomal protein S12 methylthiotransferase RimO [Phycisphaerales bacterium]
MTSSQANPIQDPKTPEGLRLAFVSLGCPKNLVDSEAMLGTLVEAGYHVVPESEPHDAIVVNTCGFLEASKDESLSVIREAIDRKKEGELKRVVVAGCLVQRHRAKMLDWAPGIDAMIGVFDRDHVIEAVSGIDEQPPDRPGLAESSDKPKYWIAGNALQAANDRGMDTTELTVHGKDGKGIGYFEGDGARLRLTPRHWAYLRMSEGCNQRCTFCTIPSIRGKMRSKSMDNILSEANALLSDGAFELNMIGQDTTNWGRDIGDDRGLVGLLTELNNMVAHHGNGWVRLMYAYPTNFTDEMIDAIASLDHIAKYIDIPLQHISDNMLTKMRRGLLRKEQEDLMYRLRERIPGLAIRTTFITGFPGETEDDHRQLVDFVRDFEFDMMGVFKYSHEEGTVAATMEKDPELCVPDEIKQQREEELMLAQQEVAFENAAYLAEEGVLFDVLVDERSHEREITEDGRSYKTYIGRCYHQAPEVDSITLLASEAEIAPGELIRCRVVDSDGYDLIMRPESELQRITSLPVIG